MNMNVIYRIYSTSCILYHWFSLTVVNYMPMTYTTLITKCHDKAGFTAQQNHMCLWQMKYYIIFLNQYTMTMFNTCLTL